MRAGLVRRDVLPPPAASAVYELTRTAGRSSPRSAARAGGALRRSGLRRPDQVLRSHWLALALKAFFRAEAADGLARVYELRLREGAFRVVVADGLLEVGAAHGDGADLVLEADDDALSSGSWRASSSRRR